MARGFTLQDIACLNLEGSSIGCRTPTPISTSTFTSSTKAFTESLNKGEEQQQQMPQQQMPQQQQQEQDESIPSNAKEGGILSCGLSWFDKKRDKRRRDHLKLEAVKQLQKIVEAERASRISTGIVGLTSVDRSRSLCDFDDDNKSLCAATSADQERIESNNSFSKKKSNPFSRMSKSKQAQYAKKQSGSIGTSDVSKSGEGVFGMLTMSDIDVLCGDDAEESVVASLAPEPAETNTKEDTIHNDNDNDIDNDDDTTDTTPPVRVTRVEADEDSPYILSEDQMNEISKYVLPESITYCRWRRLYGLGRDGDSFDGCLRIIGTKKRTLMVVRTTKGDIFGGYADAPWHSRHDSSTAKYFGSAASCLYSFASPRSPLSTSSSPESSSINVYRWTGKNRYIQVCDVSNKMLAFGGGGDKGAFGVCLQEDFQRGTTGHCDTFDNDPLCSNCERTFDIVDVEFWEFLTGIF